MNTESLNICGGYVLLTCSLYRKITITHTRAGARERAGESDPLRYFAIFYKNVNDTDGQFSALEALCRSIWPEHFHFE